MEWNKEIDTQFADDYTNLLTTEVASKYGISQKAATQRASFLQVRKAKSVNRKGYTRIELDDNEIVRLYTIHKSLTKVANIMGVTHPTIRKRLKEQGVSRPGMVVRGNIFRLYEVDDFTFANIDNQAKAYCLGFIGADGTNFGDGFAVTIHKKDIEVLEYMKRVMHSTHPIYTPKTYVSIRVNNIQISNDLLKLGMTRRKSSTLEFPTREQVPDELLSHFIRGYFDGDGSVYTVSIKSHHERCISLEFIGSVSFLLRLEEVLREKCNIPYKKLTSCSNTDKVMRLCYGGRNRVKVIYDFIYKDAEFSMSRKKERFENYYN